MSLLLFLYLLVGRPASCLNVRWVVIKAKLTLGTTSYQVFIPEKKQEENGVKSYSEIYSSACR
jgi:hypothetical protein